MRPPVPDPASFLPLSQSCFYILASLAAGPKHGYAIAKDIEILSEGRVEMAIGNLYTALKQLTKAGVIELVEYGGQFSRDRRKPYRISVLGSLVLKEEVNRFQRMLSIVEQVQDVG